MREIKVDRKTLLAKINENRKAHRDLFLKAQEGYRTDVIEELDRMLQEAKDNKPIRRGITMPEPQDHTADYDRVIAMLEMSVDVEVTIDENQFNCYVMDNWTWKAFANSTNAMYAAKAIR